MNIGKKAHFFIVVILLTLGIPFYKDVIFGFHTYYFSSSIYEYSVPAELVFQPAGGRFMPRDIYAINIYLRNPVSKYGKKYVLYMNDEKILEAKKLYSSIENKKMSVDISYKYNKYLPSNFDTILIPLEIVLHESKKVVLDKKQADNIFWSNVKFKLIFYVFYFVLFYSIMVKFLKTKIM